jgi:aminoglycoside phosphotransferase (APT) family kinase protein
MPHWRGKVERALAAVALTGAEVEPAGGMTGLTWRVQAGSDRYVLRLVEFDADRELIALAAAGAAGLPVQRLIARAPVDGVTAVVLSWLPGEPLSDALAARPERAGRYGRAFGEMHRRLHHVSVPEVVPASGWWGVPATGVPDGTALLHLDYHPLNVLVDERTVTGIIDWTNARRGDPALDLARTHTLLTINPDLAAVDPVSRAVLAEFAAGWRDGYGVAEIPPAALRWAGAVMLADLASRHPPESLAELREWTSAL